MTLSCSPPSPLLTPTPSSPPPPPSHPPPPPPHPPPLPHPPRPPLSHPPRPPSGRAPRAGPGGLQFGHGSAPFPEVDRLGCRCGHVRGQMLLVAALCCGPV